MPHAEQPHESQGGANSRQIPYNPERLLPVGLQALNKLSELAIASGAAHAAEQELYDSVHEYLGFEGEAQALTPAVWANAFNPNAPTISLRAHAFPGATLLAAAADTLRSKGESTPNVLLIGNTQSSREAITAQGYTIGRAALVHNGAVHFGDLPHQVGVTVTHRSLNGDTDTVHGLTTFNNTEVEQVLSDKAVFYERLRDILPLPHRYDAFDSTKDVAASRLLEHLHHSGQPYVIKPMVGSGGRNVQLIHPYATSLEQVRARLTASHDPKNQSATAVEMWHQSRTLLHPMSSNRLDWNIRALSYGGVVAGEYARVGRYGTPINRCAGAEAWSIEETLEACGLDSVQQADVHAQLKELYTAYGAALPGARISGLDILVDNDLRPILIEGNNDRSGGLETIHETFESGAQAIACNALRSLSGWLETLPRHMQLTARHRKLARITNELPSLLQRPEILGQPAVRDQVLAATRTFVESGIFAKAIDPNERFNAVITRLSASARHPHISEVSASLEELLELSDAEQAAQLANIMAEHYDDAQQTQLAQLHFGKKIDRDGFSAFMASGELSEEMLTAYAREIFYTLLASSDVEPLAFDDEHKQYVINALYNHLKTNNDTTILSPGDTPTSTQMKLAHGLLRMFSGLRALGRSPIDSAALYEVLNHRQADTLIDAELRTLVAHEIPLHYLPVHEQKMLSPFVEHGTLQ